MRFLSSRTALCLESKPSCQHFPLFGLVAVSPLPTAQSVSDCHAQQPSTPTTNSLLVRVHYFSNQSRSDETALPLEVEI